MNMQRLYYCRFPVSKMPGPVNLPIYKARKVVQTLFSFSGTGFIQEKI